MSLDLILNTYHRVKQIFLRRHPSLYVHYRAGHSDQVPDFW